MRKCIICKVLLPSEAAATCQKCHAKVLSSGPFITRRATLAGLSGFLAMGAGLASGRLLSENSSPTSFARSGTWPLTGEPAHTVEQIFDIKWSPDGRYIASGGEQARIWSLAEDNMILLSTGHTDEVLAVNWSPDSRYLASASFDRTVGIWDVLTGNTILRYQGHSNWVRDVAWSPRGDCIASAGYDRTVQVWQPFTGQQFVVFTGHTSEIITVAWSPDGSYIASVDAGNTLKIW